jgi:hypothetical protein
MSLALLRSSHGTRVWKTQDYDQDAVIDFLASLQITERGFKRDSQH